MNEKILLENANAEIQKKNFNEAKKYYKQILDLNSNIEKYWINYISIHINLKDFDQAEKLSIKALEKNNNFAIIHCNLGTIYQILGKYEKALKSFKKAILINNDYILPYNNLGLLFKKLNKYTEALEVFKNVVQLDEKNLIANLEIGNIYFNLKDYINAEFQYRKVIKINPNIIEAKLNLALTLKETYKYDEAEKISRELLKIKRDYFKIYYCLSTILLDKGRIDYNFEILKEAEIYARKALKLNTDYIKSYLNLSIILSELGNLDEGLTYIEKAFKLNPNDSQLNLNYKIMLKQKKLIDFLKIKKKGINIVSNKKNIKKNFYSAPEILYLEVEQELLKKLYTIHSNKIINTQGGPLFGEGKTSDYNLFDDNSKVIRRLKKNLIELLKKKFGKDIYFIDSFLNILNINSGSIKHNHINNFDKTFNLIDNKYSLTYYISVGDQKCSDPGFFKVYDPIKQILPSNGTIIIIPATRDHSSFYGGLIDRVMIGVNFYLI